MPFDPNFSGNPFDYSSNPGDYLWYKNLSPTEKMQYQQQMQMQQVYASPGYQQRMVDAYGQIGSSQAYAQGQIGSAMYGAQGQIGAANASARGQIGSAAYANDASKFGSNLEYLAQLEGFKNALERAQIESGDKRYTVDSQSGDFRYGSDRTLQGIQYGADQTRAGNYEIAGLQNDASKYGATLGYYGQQEQANAQRYGADRDLQAALEQAQTQRYGVDAGLYGQLQGYGSQERMNTGNTQSAERIAALNNESAQSVARLNNMAPLLGEVLRQKRARAAMQLLQPMIGNIGDYMSRWYAPSSQ